MDRVQINNVASRKAVRRRTAALCCLALGLSTSTFALDSSRHLTQYLHRIWQAPQGLPPASIHAILQARDGYIWLGTTAGVERFDGIRFTPLSETVGAEVLQLFEDSTGTLWISTAKSGVFAYSGTKLQKHYDTGRRIAPGLKGQVWATDGDRVVSLLTGGPSVKVGETTALAVDPQGLLWMGDAHAGLKTWDGVKLQTHSFTALPAEAAIQAFLWTSDGTFWIGTSAGLLRIQNGHQRLFTRLDGLPGNSILHLTQAASGVWVGANEGFSRIKGNEIEGFGSKQGLSQSTVYALAEDREGSLWVGTKRGLNQFLDRRTIPFTTAEGLPSNEVGPVLDDASGNLWVGTSTSGLARQDRNRFAVLTHKEGLSSNSIATLTAGSDGLLWVGTESGLNVLQSNRIVRTFTTSDGLPSNVIRSLYRDHDGGIWIGTPHGIAVFRNNQLTRVAGAFHTLSFAEDGAGNVLAATEQNGIRVYSKRSLSEQRDIAIRADTLFGDRSDGSIWAGTIGNGLFLLKDRTVTHFSVDDGLFDDDIYGIAADGRGSLWMACSKGIFSVNRSDLKKFADGEIKSIPSTPFSPLDGLQTVECKSGVQPAAWRLKNGHIAFSTIRGLLVVDPDHMEIKLAPVPVAIEAALVDGQSLDAAQIANMPPANRNLEFRFTGLSFKSPMRTTFRYTLDGFSKGWIDAGSRREAYYTNLPAGNYKFRVKACNTEGACEGDSTDLGFTIASRFYQRALFWPSVALLLGLAAWLGYQFRVRNLRQQFAMVLNERNRIGRELHDTLLQGFSGVTMQLQALSARLPAQHSTALQDIIRDAADCLREARRSVAGLRSVAPEQRPGLAAAIAKAAHQTKGLEAAHLKLKLDSTPQLPEYVEYNLLKIAQEALSNAARHSGARLVYVALKLVRGGEIELSIEDNGSGHAALREGGDGHFGLIGMKERAEHIGADFQLSSVPGTGTSIVVRLGQKVEQTHGR